MTRAASRPRVRVATLLGLLGIPVLAFASGGTDDLFTRHTLVLFALITLAAWMGFLFEKLGLPELVGEIFAGIVLGNLMVFGLDLDVGKLLRESEFMRYGAELGVVLLLFSVGLESNIRDLLKVGRNAMLVATTGVILPVVLGLAAVTTMGFASGLAGWFVGATLAATSVGVTAKALGEHGVIGSPSSQVILGAAVIDDILGILLLAMLASIATTGDFSGTSLMWILLKAVGFFAAAILVGERMLPHVIRITSINTKSSFRTAFAVCFALGAAQVAAFAGLAPIIGAFVAGLLLDDVHFQTAGNFRKQHLEDLLKPITDIMLTIFFVSIGAQVQLQALGEAASVMMVGMLLLVAILSKGVTGFLVVGRGFDRVGIGIGMIPRGEVGLIFASFAFAHHVFDAKAYSMLVMVVLLSTIAGPILLKPRLGRFATE